MTAARSSTFSPWTVRVSDVMGAGVSPASLPAGSDPDRVRLPAEVVRACVVHDCTWTYPEPRQTRFPVGDVEAFVQSANAHRAAIEAVLRAHACEHDPADWLSTIGLLRQALGTARPGHRLLALTSYATVNGVGGAAAL